MAEIYPVGVIGAASETWFAWVSADYDHVMSIDGCPVFGRSRGDLERAVSSTGRVLDWEGESLHELDALISSLRFGVGVDPEKVVNAWNFLTDLFRVMEKRPVEMFHSEMLDTYDVFLSHCDVAPLVGLRPDEISRSDLNNALIVLQDGLRLLTNL